MPSSHSSKGSESGDDFEHFPDDLEINQRPRLDSTPRTPLSPDDAFNSMGSVKVHRDSIVRFEDCKYSGGDEHRGAPRMAPRSPIISPVQREEGNSPKPVVDGQLQLLERLENLESQLRNFQLSRHLGSSEKGDDSSERTGLSTEIQWMTWQEYLDDASKPTNILEVLIEKPHTSSRRKASVSQATIDVLPQRKLSTKPSKGIERIRIRSFHIINALQTLTEQTFSSSSRLIIHSPFKLFLFYHEQIQEYLHELEDEYAKNTECGFGEQCELHDLPEMRLRPQKYRRRSSSEQQTSRGGPDFEAVDSTHNENLNVGKCGHELSEEVLAQEEAITHLNVFTNFLKDDMRDVFAKHELLRSSNAGKVTFQDLWHLFMAGDLVVAENESGERGLELYQVSILPACEVFSSRRPVKSISTRTEGSHQLVESVYKEEAISAMSMFTVDVFYFDFDGQRFGPVEKRLQLMSFEGEKNIVDLPIYPLRYHKDADQFKEAMLARGKKFRELSAANTYPHREYNGLSMGEPQEQVSESDQSACSSADYS